MQDGQDRAVASRIEELVRMPAPGERTGLRFAIADDARGDEVGIVEHRPVSVREGIPQLATFGNRAGNFGGNLARDAPWKRKLFEELSDAVFILRHVRIEFAVSPFQICVSNQPRPAMAGTGDVNQAQVALLNNAVEMDIDEVESRRRAPVPEQARFDVFAPEGPFEQRISIKINLAHGEVIGRAPIGIHFWQQIRAERFLIDAVHIEIELLSSPKEIPVMAPGL